MKLISNCFFVITLLLVSCQKNQGENHAADASSITPLKKGDVIRAVHNDDLDAVKKLLTLGADINENIGSPTQEITPLLAAIALGRENISHYLIERGAALHSQYKGYKPEIFSMHVLGESSKVTRSLRNKGNLVVRGTGEGK